MIVSLVARVGIVVLLGFMLLEGTKGPNRYGPDPKGSEGAPAAA